MTREAQDLLSIVQLIFGLPTLFLPVFLAILARDKWAVGGTIVVLLFAISALAASRGGSIADQMMLMIGWLAAMILGVGVYVRRKDS